MREQPARWQSDSAATTYLLDVNVLIAMVDSLHSHHQRAHAWMQTIRSRWATCPLTENGVVRIIGNKRYSNPVSVARATVMMSTIRTLRGHVFWPDDISLMDPQRVDPARLLDSSQISDTYLLALAVAHGGKLATFDKRLVAAAVKGGRAALQLIE